MNTGYRQWLRLWRVTVTPKNGGEGMDVSNLRCAFKIEKQLKDSPNYSQIVITNPALSTIQKIQPGDKVTVEAGYQNGNFGMIFSGEVVEPYISRDEVVDTNLTLVCQDGDQFLNHSFTMKTLEKGSTTLDVVNACSEGMTQGLITDKLSEQPALIRGKVLFGQSANYLKRAAYNVLGQFYIEDSEINIVAAEDYKAGEIVELSPDTGLIGDPSQTDDGVSVKCLINPSIKLNTQVHISPDTVQRKMVSKSGDKQVELAADGIYKVVKITYSGDTHSDDWYCEIDGVSKSAEKGDSTANVTATGYTTEGGDNKSVAVRIGEALFNQNK